MVKETSNKETRTVRVNEWKKTSLTFVNGKRTGQEWLEEHYSFDCPDCDLKVTLDGRWISAEDCSDKGRDYYTIGGFEVFCPFCGMKYMTEKGPLRSLKR